MQATPPPSAQVLPEASATPARSRPRPGPEPEPIAAAPATADHPSAGPKPSHLRPAEPVQAEAEPVAFGQASAETADATPTPPKPDSGATASTVIPRRPVIEDARRSRADVPWLGIGSWLLLCAALFASLVGWPDQTALDRVTSIWPGKVASTTLARRPAQQEPTSTDTAPSQAPEQDWSAMTPGPANEGEVLPPTELAPPIRSEAPSDTTDPAAGSPPLPRFKPSVDRVAAEFSNAFFEIGDQLQQQGDLDAAIHMKRQGINLDPWKAPGASDL
jgi:hypothetical protein